MGIGISRSRQRLIFASTLRKVTKSVTIRNVETFTEVVRAVGLADWLLAHGVSHITTKELSQVLGVPPDQVRRRLHVPSRRGEWVSPAQGLWIPVPVEYRLWGAPEGIEIIETLMAHLGVDYYVGWLSAAQIHGAAHQSPQVFQVAAGRQVRNRVVGRTRFQFHIRGGITAVPVIEHQTRAGVARVSSREATVLDLAMDLDVAGGIHNAATVISELAQDDLEVDLLADQAERLPAAVGRRAGWILENLAGQSRLDVFRERVADRAINPSWLDPYGPRNGLLDRRWLLRVNTEVDMESL